MDLLQVAKAARDVAFFTKHREYPEVGSRGFQELTVLLNKLEVELVKVDMPITKKRG